MTGLMLAAMLAPIGASIATLIGGWRRATATLIVLSAVTVLACGAALGFHVGSGARFALGGLLRVDALTVTMLVVIGVVATLATWASIGYLDTELAHGHTDLRGARAYGALTAAFLAAMVLAVCANNIGVIWVAIEATTVITAFLVGHRRTRGARGSDLEVRRDLLGRHRDRLSGHRAAVLRRRARRRTGRGAP